MLVETQSLTKRYNDVTALDDCTVSVQRGEVFGLLGPNGAGKTTLLRLLLGYLHPTRGSAHIDGLCCHHKSVEVRKRVAYLPGDARLFRHMRGREVLTFFAEIRGNERLHVAHQLAKRLDLDLSRRVGFMSTGMRQKLALAATLSADTPLVILDEPTANLDPTVRGEVMAMVAEAQKAGSTVMFSSHVLSEVEEVCDRVVILRKGRLVHTQVMADLHRQHRIRASLAGDLPPPPEELREALSIKRSNKRDIVIETPDALPPLLGWLATLPLEEMKIEPVGLRAVYDRFHTENGKHVSAAVSVEAATAR